MARRPRSEGVPAARTDLIVAVHQLQPSTGLLLLHVAQRALQAEHHVLVLLHDLREEPGLRGGASELCCGLSPRCRPGRPGARDVPPPGTDEKPEAGTWSSTSNQEVNKCPSLRGTDGRGGLPSRRVSATHRPEKTRERDACECSAPGASETATTQTRAGRDMAAWVWRAVQGRPPDGLPLRLRAPSAPRVTQGLLPDTPTTRSALCAAPTCPGHTGARTASRVVGGSSPLALAPSPALPSGEREYAALTQDMQEADEPFHKDAGEAAVRRAAEGGTNTGRKPSPFKDTQAKHRNRQKEETVNKNTKLLTNPSNENCKIKPVFTYKFRWIYAFLKQHWGC